MAPLGSLKRIKKFYEKAKKVVKKAKDWVKDKGIDLAVKGIKFLKSGKVDIVLNLVKSVFPQAAIATEIVDKLRLLLNKVDEDKLKDVLKKVLNGDLTELRELSKVYNVKGSIDTYDKYFGDNIN
ncbi:MAG: hypothetical protein ACI32H_02400 [Bacilli bacterium]